MNIRHIRDGLCIALDGPGAFRRFKTALRRFHMEEEWYAYKEEEMLDFAANGVKKTISPLILRRLIERIYPHWCGTGGASHPSCPSWRHWPTAAAV